MSYDSNYTTELQRNQAPQQDFLVANNRHVIETRLENIASPQQCEDIASFAVAQMLAESADGVNNVSERKLDEQITQIAQSDEAKKQFAGAIGAKLIAKKRGRPVGSRNVKGADHVQKALKIIDNGELLKTNEGSYLFAYKLQGKRKVLTIAGADSSFTRWMRVAFERTYNEIVTDGAIKTLVDQCRARADILGRKVELHTRKAFVNGKLYLDLHNANGEIAEISREGWQVIESSEDTVLFRAPENMKALPLPDPAGSVEDIFALLPPSIKSDSGEAKLLLGWLLGTLIPRGSLVHLSLIGESGSAKSSIARTLRMLIDPNETIVVNSVSNQRDLAIAARNHQLIVVDNLSAISKSVSDMLCCLSTGSGLVTRKLYSDGEEQSFSFMRPAILTSIENIVWRPDLVSRCIFVELEKVPPIASLEDGEVEELFHERASRALGALLNLCVLSLRNWRSPELRNVIGDQMPRMVGFTLWVEAACEGFGWKRGEFLAEYNANLGKAMNSALNSSIIATILLRMLAQPTTAAVLAGGITCGQLLERLHGHADMYEKSRLPITPEKLSGELRRLKTAFELSRGIFVEVDTQHTLYGNVLKIGAKERS